MIISKCVPMEVKRIKFSQFDETAPENVQFVGWKVDDEGQKKNVQVDYTQIQNDVVRIVNEIVDSGEAGEVQSFKLYTEEGDEDKRDPRVKYNATEETWTIDLTKRAGFLEINGGGGYDEEYVYFLNPRVGNISTVVVDNTGSDKGELPTGDFVLYYGLKNYGTAIPVLEVPKNYRGIVQILHTSETDLILNTSYTEWTNKYIPDQVESIKPDDHDEYDIDNPYMGKIVKRCDEKLFIDMDNESGFFELNVAEDGRSEYIFIFQNTKIGSMTYIVLDNTNGKKVAQIRYGKPHPTDEYVIIQNPIVDVDPDEKVVIEVFHSLSVDIIAKITTL